ncbi:MAG TPA: SGNH hydrolase domain-containing protein [Acidimicrobiales bacterium]
MGHEGAGHIKGKALAARRGHSLPRALVALVSALSLVVVAVVTLLVIGSDDDGPQRSATTDAGENAAAPTDAPSTTVAPTTTAATVPPTTRPPRDLGRLMLVGDSVAATLTKPLAFHAKARGIPYNDQTVPGCGMITGLPTAGPTEPPVPWAATCEQAVLDSQPGLAIRRSAGTVLWLSSWETADRWVDGSVLVFGTPEGDARLLELMEQARARILAGSDALLVLVKAAPNAAMSQRGPADENNVERMVHLNELFDRFAATHPVDTRVLDMVALVCPGGPPCPPVVDGVELRPVDGGHFSDAGAAWVVPRLLDEIVAVAS